MLRDLPLARERMREIRSIVEHPDEFPNSLEFPITRYDFEDGYTEWAPSYDGPNPAIEAEQPIVRAMVQDLTPGTALDAACGTGRHAAMLAELGWDVVGVDATPAMLDVARAKVPKGDFRAGRLEALPVDDASVDLVTCALALTHVDDLQPVIREFARVLRPGGQAILSDIHPFMTMTSSVAAFQPEDRRRGIPHVVNLTHQLSEYVQAFLAAGLRIVECLEPPVDDKILGVFPTFAVYADATRAAFEGVPYLLIWRLQR
jgi:ubiquinone/menaquinone biosynthesis C-methylase UbiE